MTGAGRAHRVATLSFAVVAALAAAVAAAPPPSRLVVLARAEDADEATGEALARVSDELTAAGFAVRTVRVVSGADPRLTVETVGRELSPAAAFAIFPGTPTPDGRPSAEIWVSDRLTGRATVEHLSVGPRDSDRGAAVLAVRAVELLKASVAELWVGDETPPKDQAPPETPHARDAHEGTVPVTIVATAAPRSWADPGTGLEATAAVVGHPGGFPVDVGPLLRLSLGIGRRLALRLGLFGLDRGWTLSTGDGSTRVHTQLSTADVVVALRPGHRWQARLSAGLGASRLAVSGTGNAPWVGQSNAAWSGVAGAGAGAAFFMTESVAVVAEVDAELFWNRPVVRVGDSIAGRAGRPALIGTLGLRLAL